MNLLRLISIFVVVLPLSACAISGGSVSGKVLEEGTNKPIPGVIVVVSWIGPTTSGSIYVEARDVCYHVETATTNEQGLYQTKAWSQEQNKNFSVKFDRMQVFAYKVGYGYSQSVSQTEGIEYLALFKGSREERLKYLLNMSHGADCYSADEKPLFPLQRALFQEAKGLAVTPQDQAGVQRIKYRAAKVWKRSEVYQTESEIETLIRNDKFLSEQLK